MIFVKNSKIFILTACIITYFFIIILLEYTIKNKNPQNEIEFKISECENYDNENYKIYYFQRENNSIIAYISVNCCSDEIKVVKNDNFYIIKEIDRDGLLCRCMCNKKLEILNAENIGVKFLDYANNYIILKEFCGRSMLSTCNSDKDCIVSGCANEICANETLFSICIWKECYKNLREFRCACVKNKCQWIIIK